MPAGSPRPPPEPGNELGLAGYLLCAVPQLLDANFRRAVVLLLEHAPSGALGLVLNNPVATPVESVADALELEWCGDPAATVRLGGPVETSRGWIVHDDSAWDPDALELGSDGQVFLTTSLERIRALGRERFGEDSHRYLFFVGYAGWGPGQLEAELAAGSWVLVPVRGLSATAAPSELDADWLFETAPGQMWDRALRALGISPERLVGLQGGAIH